MKTQKMNHLHYGKSLAMSLFQPYFFGSLGSSRVFLLVYIFQGQITVCNCPIGWGVVTGTMTQAAALLLRRTGNSEHGLAPVRHQSNGNLAAEM